MKIIDLCKYFPVIILCLSGHMFGIEDSFDPGMFNPKIEINDRLEKREVTMWNQQEVHLAPEEIKRKILYTNSLGGCIAAAFVVQCKDKSLHAHMSHYPPTDRSKQTRELGNAHDRFNTLCQNAVEFKKLLVMTPGEWVKKGEKWEMQAQDLNYPTMLGCAARIQKPTVLAYSTMQMLGEERYDNEFELSLNNDGQKRVVEYHSKSDHNIRHLLLSEKVSDISAAFESMKASSCK